MRFTAAVVLLLSLVACGTTTAPSAVTATPTPAPTAKPTPTPAPGPVTLKGTTTEITYPFSLPPGVVNVSWTTTAGDGGACQYSGSLNDGNGNGTDTENYWIGAQVNELFTAGVAGFLSGNQILNGFVGGRFTLDMQVIVGTGCSWSVTFTPTGQ